MGVWQVSGVALLAAMLILLLRELRAVTAVSVRLAATVLLCLSALSLYAPVLSRVRALFSLGGGSVLAQTVLRAVGVGVICELSASFCRDLGENTLADGVVLFGKIEILVLALPLVDELIEMVGELLK